MQQRGSWWFSMRSLIRRRARGAVLCVAVLSVALSVAGCGEAVETGGAGTEDEPYWPMLRHDARDTGQAEAPDAPAASGSNWVFPSEAGVLGVTMSPSVVGSDGTIYAVLRVQGGNGRLVALSPSGQEVWSVDSDRLLISAFSPAIGPDGTVYVMAAGGFLRAYGQKGELRWEYGLDGHAATSPVTDARGTVYAGCRSESGGTLHAVSSDGTPVWIAEVGTVVDESLAVDEIGKVYVGDVDGKVWAVDADGEVSWVRPFDGDWIRSISLGPAGTVYAVLGSGELVALVPDNGEALWRYEGHEGRYRVSTAAYIAEDGTIYVGSALGVGAGLLQAISSDGSELWRVDLGEPAIGGCTASRILDTLGQE